MPPYLLLNSVVEFTLVLLNIMATYGQGVEYVIARDMNIRLLLEILYTEVNILFVYKLAGGLASHASHAGSSGKNIN